MNTFFIENKRAVIGSSITATIATYYFYRFLKQKLQKGSQFLPLYEEKVIPDVLKTQPKQICTISFGKNKVNLGNKLTPSQVREFPNIQWIAEKNTYYSIILTDPDDPSRDSPLKDEWRHLLIVNIEGNNIQSGEFVHDFISSAPPQNSGFHRYVWVILKQPGKINCKEQKIKAFGCGEKIRASGHKIVDFMKRYNCELEAANFYLCEWDSLVPLIEKQIEGIIDFETEGIIPDVLSQEPQQICKVTYQNKSVQMGNFLTPTEVREFPKIEWNHEKDLYYTIILTDPDAPSRSNPIYSEWRHFLAVNIQGDKIQDGEHIHEFIPSAPGKDSGKHRYIWVILQQPGKIDCKEQKIQAFGDGFEKRRLQKVNEFAIKYDCKVISANFYYSEFDDTVPKIHDQIKGIK